MAWNKRGVQNYRSVLHLHLSSTYQAFNIAQAQKSGSPSVPGRIWPMRVSYPTLSQLSSSLYCICKHNPLLPHKGKYKPTAGLGLGHYGARLLCSPPPAPSSGLTYSTFFVQISLKSPEREVDLALVLVGWGCDGEGASSQLMDRQQNQAG